MYNMYLDMHRYDLNLVGFDLKSLKAGKTHGERAKKQLQVLLSINDFNDLGIIYPIRTHAHRSKIHSHACAWVISKHETKTTGNVHTK